MFKTNYENIIIYVNYTILYNISNILNLLKDLKV